MNAGSICRMGQKVAAVAAESMVMARLAAEAE